MKIKGIKRGKNIEILQEIDIPDGMELVIEIQPVNILSEEERIRKLKDFFESDWEGREDFIKTMEELEHEKQLISPKSLDISHS
jgi:hypothetical protein